jgi:sugar diacid utilization regulator
MSGTLQQKQEIINALQNYVFHNVSLKESADRLGISKQLLAFRIDKLSPIVQKEIYNHLHDLFDAK